MNAARIEISLDGSVAVARLTGEIDLANAQEVFETLQEGMPADADGMVIDLAGVAYIDSGGIRVLFKLARAFTAKEQTLVVSVPEGSPLRRLLKVARLEGAIPVCGSTDAAVETARTQT
jgi:anti-sigma B factor antagonist